MLTASPTDRQVYNRRYYRAHRAGVAARNLQTRIARGESLPPGQYVGHCGLWQKLDALPHVCTRCGVPLFAEEEAPCSPCSSS